MPGHDDNQSLSAWGGGRRSVRRRNGLTRAFAPSLIRLVGLALVAASCMHLGCSKSSDTAAPAEAQGAYVELGRQGDQAMAQGNPAEAKRLYLQGLEQAEALAERQPRLVDAWLDVGLFARRLGEIAASEGAVQAARSLFHKQLAVAKVVSELQPASVRAQEALFQAYNRVGQYALENMDVETAKGYFRDQFQQPVYAPETIDEALTNMQPASPEQRTNLRIMYRRMGWIAQQDQDMEAAHRYFQKAQSAGLN